MGKMIFMRALDLSGSQDPVDLATAGYILISTIERLILEVDAEKYPRFYCKFQSPIPKVIQFSFYGLTEGDEVTPYTRLIDGSNIHEGETKVEQEKIRQKKARGKKATAQND